jgi:hypothetical protein
MPGRGQRLDHPSLTDAQLRGDLPSGEPPVHIQPDELLGVGFRVGTEQAGLGQPPRRRRMRHAVLPGHRGRRRAGTDPLAKGVGVDRAVLAGVPPGDPGVPQDRGDPGSADGQHHRDVGFGAVYPFKRTNRYLLQPRGLPESAPLCRE